jgi:hypothetical protein
MDWQAMLKDKKLWIGVAAVAALGLFVYSRRTKTATPATTPAGTTANTGGAVADTTGTDLASFLGNFSQSLQAQIAQLNAGNQTAAGTATPTPVLPTPANHYGGYEPLGGGIFAVPVAAGTNWANLGTTLNTYGLNGDIQSLINLNPGIMGDVNDFKDPSGNWQNVFKNPITIKVPKL